jgi:predicted O-methyltransferase YrrM
LRRLLRGDITQLGNVYDDVPWDSHANARFCAELLGLTEARCVALLDELSGYDGFLARLTERYKAVRGRELELGRFRCWWALVRALRPQTVIETGVHDGLSTALVLHALEENGTGRLVSIDLPSVDLPTGVPGPGWLVSDEHRGRWTLMTGDTRVWLPRVLQQHPVDLFIHDSDHSASHQEFEFRAARSRLSPGGILAGDDPVESLMIRLAVEWGGTAVLARVAGAAQPYLGGVAGLR